jgi:hypothetical protein
MARRTVEEWLSHPDLEVDSAITSKRRLVSFSASGRRIASDSMWNLLVVRGGTLS